MTAIVNTSRRAFLKTAALTGGGLVLGVHFPRGGHVAARPAETALNAWLRIGTDDSITIVVARSEMGQGVYTALPMLVAEELEVDWQRVRVDMAPVKDVYRNSTGVMLTGASRSIRESWEPLRKAGAAARHMLIAAAAQEWRVNPGECVAQQSMVVHQASGKTISYGALVDAASKLEPPQEPTLKSPDQFRLIGQSMARLDLPAKVDGSAVFGIDVKVPNMLVAAVKMCPVFGGTVARVDDRAAKAMKGVRAVVPLSNAVAVVADGYWQAQKALERLEVTFDQGENATLGSDVIARMYRDALSGPAAVAYNQGDVQTAFATAVQALEAEYDVPFLAHAPMEPMNCTVHVRADGCDIWAPTQAQEWVQSDVATALGLPKEAVSVHTTFLGGGFGRRLETDYAVQAALVSKAVGRPVKVIWSRADDMQQGFYRPAFLGKLRAGLDRDGMPMALTIRTIGPSVVARETVLKRGSSKLVERIRATGIDPMSVEGLTPEGFLGADRPAVIPNFRVETVLKDTGIPVSPWRSVGSSFTAFFIEGFIDEIAHAGGQDPYLLRRRLLAPAPRYLAVLDLAAEKAGWGKPLPVGRHRGIAIYKCFGTVVAQVAEVSVTGSRVRLHRVVCAVDCGTVVHPDTVAAQMEGSIVFGLTAAFNGAITIKDGRAVQSNFHDYRMLRMGEMPVIEVHIVKSTEPPSGVGEPGVPPIAPAITNALFAATGKRIRSLPIRKHGLSLEEQNPFPSTSEIIAEGRQLYLSSGCYSCHGLDATGRGKLGPDLTKLRQKTEPDIHEILLRTFGGKLSSEERWKIATYLRSLAEL